MILECRVCLTHMRMMFPPLSDLVVRVPDLMVSPVVCVSVLGIFNRNLMDRCGSLVNSTASVAVWI
jgi:hypothetical protein